MIKYQWPTQNVVVATQHRLGGEVDGGFIIL